MNAWLQLFVRFAWESGPSPYRQPTHLHYLHAILLFSMQVLCRVGHVSPAGASECKPCPSGTYASTGGDACTACPATLPFSYRGSASESSCMCPPGHACSTNSTPIVCPEGTFSPAGSLRGACQPCPPYMVSPAGAYTCVPACPTVLTELRDW